MNQSLAPFNPGWQPVGPRLLVYPTPIQEFTDGGIALPVQYTDREELKQIEALVISVGIEAFEDVQTDWCEPGDTILMAAFAGRLLLGLDGRKYRLILDGEVTAIKDPIPDTSSCTDQAIMPVGMDSSEAFGNG